MTGKWVVQSAESSDQAASILIFLLKEFSRLVGSDIMYNEDCTVYNDPHAECPMLLTGKSPVRIRLAQSSYLYWAQTVYQLSHEMCHYAFRQYKENKEYTLHWFEEIVCEAMSLYALKFISSNWRQCSPSKLNPQYDNSIETYLKNVLSQTFTSGLKGCDTVAKLTEYEKERRAESKRESIVTERNITYSALSSNPMELRCLLDYTKHIESNGVVIDFDGWIQDAPCNILCVLKQIQPVKCSSNKTAMTHTH